MTSVRPVPFLAYVLLLGAGLVATSSGGGAALSPPSPVHEETVTGAASGSATVSTSAGIGAGPNELFLAAVASKPFTTVTSMTGLGLVWTPREEQCGGRNQTGVSVWSAQGTPTGGGIVAAAMSSAPARSVITVTRYSGVDPAAAVAAVTSANSNGGEGSCSGGDDASSYALDVTTSVDGAAVFVAVAHRNRSHSPGSAFTERAEVHSGSGGEEAAASVMDAIVASSGTLTVDGSFDGVVDWAAVAVVVNPTLEIRTLTVDTVGPGAVAAAPPGGTYALGTEVTLTAEPSAGWRLQGWGGSLSGNANPVALTMDDDHIVTATFEPIPLHVVTVETVGLGSVVLGPPGGTYGEGSRVAVIANPVPGWRFDRWEGALGGSTNPDSITVAAGQTVRAVFSELSRHALQVSSVGAGSVLLSPPGGEYDEGTVVTLTALPLPGWSFDQWIGSLGGAVNPQTVVMNGGHSVVAQFLPVTGGKVTFAECRGGGASGEASVTTSGSLTAVEGDLYLATVSSRPFDAPNGVSGLGLAWTEVESSCSGRSQAGVSVWQALGAPAASGPVTAAFADVVATAAIAVVRYSGVDASAPIGAVVSGNSNGVDGACSGGGDESVWSLPVTVGADSVVVFGTVTHRSKTHAPGTGLTERLEIHEGAGGDETSVSIVDRSVAAPAATTVDGTFDTDVDWAGIAVELRPGGDPNGIHLLDLAVAGLGGIVVDPPGPAYPDGAVVTLTAVPHPGWEFGSWSGALSGSDPTESITMLGTESVQASFLATDVGDVTVSTIGTGNIVRDPPGGVYPTGTNVTLTAVPFPDWIFDRWEGALQGGANPASITANADHDVVAVFTPVGAATSGIWTSAAELAATPTSGPGWEAVLAAANENFHPPSFAQSSDDNVRCLAAAIAYARTGDTTYRDEVVGACSYLAASGNPGHNTLAWAREIGAYAMAADLVGWRTAEFEDWLRDMAETYVAADGRTLISMFRARPNNWGTSAFGALAAVYSYLGDTAALNGIRDYWLRGVRGPNPGFEYRDLSWHADPTNPRQINPPGSMKDGVVLDGALPDDVRRGGSFTDPPGLTEYPWGALQGLITAARVLERYDPYFAIWHVEEKAIHRAARLLQVVWQDAYGGWAAAGDDAWMLRFLDDAYGTTWSVGALEEWGAGKNAGWPYVLMSALSTSGGGRADSPLTVRLDQNFPNPFGPGTRIRYHLPRSGPVELSVYDVAGRLVVTLLDDVQGAGTHTMPWRGVDSRGRAVASGIYWCRIVAGPERRSIKLTVLR